MSVVPSEDTGQRIDLMFTLREGVWFTGIADHLYIAMQKAQCIVELLTLGYRYAGVSLAVHYQDLRVALGDKAHRRMLIIDFPLRAKLSISDLRVGIREGTRLRSFVSNKRGRLVADGPSGPLLTKNAQGFSSINSSASVSDAGLQHGRTNIRFLRRACCLLRYHLPRSYTISPPDAVISTCTFSICTGSI